MPGANKKCQILVKKGFLSARDLTSDLALLVYSQEFQLGVLLHLSPSGSLEPIQMVKWMRLRSSLSA